MTTRHTMRTARRRRLLLAASVAVGLAVAVVGWIGLRAALASSHLDEAQAAASSVRGMLDDPDAAATVLAELAHDTARARALTSDPVWEAVEQVPVLGAQLQAAGTVTTAVDDAVRTGFIPLARAAAQDLTGIRSAEGVIDVNAFDSIARVAAHSAERIDEARSSVAAVDRGALLGPLRDAVDDVSRLLDSAHAAADGLSRAAGILPSMLGAEDPRHYLLLFQNNAEWRSLGGIPGALALLRVEAGSFELVRQESTDDFRRFREPVLPLDPEIEAIYGERPGRWIQNITQVPDFAVTAELAREMWAREHGGQLVDGVVSFDPVALSYLLAATGPVTTPSGDVLSATTAVDVLLNDSYLRFDDPVAQDEFFAGAATSVFSAVSGGEPDTARLASALVRAVDERRLLAWSADPSERAMLREIGVAGGLPPSDSETARFGVFLNDGTGSKMDYYQSARSTVRWTSCEPGEGGGVIGVARLDVVIENRAPADAASLPHYITSGGRYGVAPGTVRTIVYVYLPPGFDLVGATATGDSGFGGGEHDGRRVVSASVEVGTGASASISITARPRDAAPSALEVMPTPTIAPMAAERAVCEP